MNPEPISIIQALEDLSLNRLAQFVRRRWGWKIGFVVVALIILAVFAPAYSVGILVGAFLSILIVLVLYLVAHAHFVAMIRKKRPLCPSCKALVWQIRCSQCKNPVPPLALLLKGFFLGHCPHCGSSINVKGTLEGWCSLCSNPIPRPARHFFLQPVVEIEVGDTFPTDIPKDWEVREKNSKFIEIHLSHNGIASTRDKLYPIRYYVTHDRESLKSINDIIDKMYEYVPKIWIRQGVTNYLVHKDVLDNVPPSIRPKTELFFEGNSVLELKKIKEKGFAKIHTNVPRSA